MESTMNVSGIKLEGIGINMSIRESARHKNDTMCLWFRQSLSKKDLALEASLKKKIQLK